MEMVRGIETREFGFRDVLQGGWAVWRAHPAAILGILLTFYVPSTLVHWYLTEFSTNFFAATLGPLVVIVLYEVVGAMALILLVESHIRGGATGYRDVVGGAMSRWIPGALTGALVMVMIAFLMILLIVPAVIAGTNWAFTPMLVALRGERGWDALHASASLVYGRWWKVFGISLRTFLVLGGVPMALLVALEIGFPEAHGYNLMVALLIDIASTISVAVLTVFFLNVDYRAHPSQPEPPRTGRP